MYDQKLEHYELEVKQRCRNDKSIRSDNTSFSYALHLEKCVYTLVLTRNVKKILPFADLHASRIDILSKRKMMVKEKKRNTSIYFNINYRIEMKLVPIIMDYCLFQFDVLNFFLEVRLHGGSLPNVTFFNVNPQIF